MKTDNVLNKGIFLVFAVATACVLLAVVAGKAKADDLSLQPGNIVEISAGGVDPVHEIISKQLDAIKDRNAIEAFAMATDSFHNRFNTANGFLSQMRVEYRPLYNYDSITFLERNSIADGILQHVKITDQYGEPILVIYRLEKQDNGQWLIDSFTVLNSHAQPV